MKSFSVSLTLSIDAENEQEAYEEFEERIKEMSFDKDSLEIEEEK